MNLPCKPKKKWCGIGAEKVCRISERMKTKMVYITDAKNCMKMSAISMKNDKNPRILMKNWCGIGAIGALRNRETQ